MVNIKVKELNTIKIERAIGGYSMEIRFGGLAYRSDNYVFKNGEEQEMLEFMIKLLNNKKLGIVEID